MKSVFNDVRMFMEAADQTTLGYNVPQSSLYMKLIGEEFSELLTAKNQNNDAEIADACFDLMWVVVGYMLSRGWDVNKIWDEGALSNLRKIDPETRKVLKREDGKVLKPEGWQPPNFSQYVG